MNEENKDDTPTDELLMSKKPEDIREVRRLVDQISGFKGLWYLFPFLHTLP